MLILKHFSGEFALKQMCLEISSPLMELIKDTDNFR
jgi:hypothetical protein